MNANLQDGKIKVTGVVENVAWRERHEAQKKARAERNNDPEFRAKYEARQEAKRKKEESREAEKEARIQARVREKTLHETYKQLGIGADYIQMKQAQIDAAKAKNPTTSQQNGSLGRLKTQEQVAMGAGGSAAADQREMRGLGKDIAITAGGAVIAAAGGLEAIATPIIGAAAYESIIAAVGAVAGASFFGPAVALGTIAILTRKFMKKAKARRANQADQAQKLDDFQADLDNFKKQLDAVQNTLVSNQDMLVEKYKSMKKGQFNAYLKGYIAELLKTSGLTADNEAVNEAAEKISQGIEAENKQEEPKPETEEKEEDSEPEKEEAEKEEPENEEPAKENPEAEAPNAEAPEQETQAPEVQEPAQGEEKPAQETEAPVIDEGDLSGPDEPDQEVAPATEESAVSSISAEELAAEKDAMMAEGLIERPEEKQAQIQEQIRRAEEERAREQQREVEDKSEMGD